jgi:hypothetical protein
MYEKLQYRRQFILTTAPLTPPADWKGLKLDQYLLYTHPDLVVTRVSDPKKTIVLMGHIFDSEEPEKGNIDILNDILERANGLEGFIAGLKKYSGNYALLYQDDQDAVILQDALALKQIYYCTVDNLIVCGSQPNVIVKFAHPELGQTDDPDLLDFYKNRLKETRWVGSDTVYKGVKHLQPNHYLDIGRREAKRYWPREPVKRLGLNEAVSISCRYLQGILKAMAHRHSLMMAVTAGTDSRVLLAASQGIRDKIYYFINNHTLGHNHPDISVPKKIFDRIGVPFHVHDVPGDMDDEFRRIQLSNTFFVTARLLATIYNIYFKRHGDKVNITGTGEIGRMRFGREPKHLNSYLAAYKLGYADGGRYVIKQCEKILDELLPAARKCGINPMTLLYWEQLNGNWGTAVNAETEIAVEVFDPYGSHLLYETFLGVDETYVKYNEEPCVFFREMIRHMWPQLLEWPINPPDTMWSKAAVYLGKAGVMGWMKELKYQMNYAGYLYRERRQGS